MGEPEGKGKFDTFFDRHEFETMRQGIAKLKTEYEKVGDEPDGRLQRMDTNAFGENDHSQSTSKAMTDHLGGVKDSFNTARDRLHEIERALDGVYNTKIENEKIMADNFTPKD